MCRRGAGTTTAPAAFCSFADGPATVRHGGCGHGPGVTLSSGQCHWRYHIAKPPSPARGRTQYGRSPGGAQDAQNWWMRPLGHDMTSRLATRSYSAIFRWGHGIPITHRDRRRACRVTGRRDTCCRQASDAAGGPGRAGYSARPAAGQTPATWPSPSTAPVRPHHSAEPSGYVAACGRQGRRASGLQQRTGRDPSSWKGLPEPHCDQLLDQRLWQGLVDAEAQGP
jgi:hypothetical protein